MGPASGWLRFLTVSTLSLSEHLLPSRHQVTQARQLRFPLLWGAEAEVLGVLAAVRRHCSQAFSAGTIRNTAGSAHARVGADRHMHTPMNRCKIQTSI